MIAVETNILVYAHRRDSPFHVPAAASMRRLAQEGAPWAIPWPCVHEFLGVVTRPRVYEPPSSVADAVAQVEKWMRVPTLNLLSEDGAYAQPARRLAGCA